MSIKDTRTMRTPAEPVEAGRVPQSLAVSPDCDRVSVAVFTEDEIDSFRTADPHSVSGYAAKAP